MPHVLCQEGTRDDLLGSNTVSLQETKRQAYPPKQLVVGGKTQLFNASCPMI